MSLDLPAWQKVILDAQAKDPEKFKRAVLWRPDRSYWKRQAQQQLFAALAVAEIIKEEQK